MDVPTMSASVDVAEKLNHIERRLDFHDGLHQQNTETLKEIKNVLVNQAVHDERMTNMSLRQDGLNKKFDKIVDKVERNTTQITKWVGGLAALTIAFTIITTWIKLTPSQPHGVISPSPAAVVAPRQQGTQPHSNR